MKFGIVGLIVAVIAAYVASVACMPTAVRPTALLYIASWWRHLRPDADKQTTPAASTAPTGSPEPTAAAEPAAAPAPS